MSNCVLLAGDELPPRARSQLRYLRSAVNALVVTGEEGGQQGQERDGCGGGWADWFVAFLFDISKKGAIARLKQRLGELRFLFFLRPAVADLRQLNQVYDDVLHFAPIRYILRIVLAVGNFLNHHRRPHGQPAPGFSFESISRLADVKSSDGRTLLHFIVCVLARDASWHLDALSTFAPALKIAVRAHNISHSDVIDFAQIWLAHRRSGGDGAPPLPPPSPPPSARQTGRTSRYIGGSPVAHSKSPHTSPASPSWTGVHGVAGNRDHVEDLAAELLHLEARVNFARDAAHTIYGSAQRKDLLSILFTFVHGIFSAARDLKWAHIAHPRGSDSIVPARHDLWHRISETEGLNSLLGRPEFSELAARLCHSAAQHFVLAPRHVRAPLPVGSPAAAGAGAAGGGGGQVWVEEEVQGSSVHKWLMKAEAAELPAMALTLAGELDGSAGGGYEKAVMWSDFNESVKIKKLSDGKLYFVVRQQAENDDGNAERAGVSGLWNFALQDYGEHAVAASAHFTD